MISWTRLVRRLKNIVDKYNLKLVMRSNYVVVLFPNSHYHATIFQDQWDSYSKYIGHNYSLMHFSSDSVSDRCSIYFVVDVDLKLSQATDFEYQSPNYSMSSSTRSKCDVRKFRNDINLLQKVFYKINYI